MTPPELYQAISGTFYDDLVHSINPLRRWFHLNRYDIINSLVKSYWRPESQVLDLGSGSCTWNRDRLPVTGVDLNESLLRYGMEQGRLARYHVADLNCTDLPDGAFDVVVACDVVEHMSDPDAVLAEIQRLLRPGGVMLLSVPYDTLFSAWAPLFLMHSLYMGYIRQSAYYRDRCGHVQHFSPGSMQALVQRNRFELELVFSWRRLSLFVAACKPPLEQQRPLPDLTMVLLAKRSSRRLVDTARRLMQRYPDAGLQVVSCHPKADEALEGLEQGPLLRCLPCGPEGPRGTTGAVLRSLQQVRTEYAIFIVGEPPPALSCLGRMYNQVARSKTIAVAARPHLHHPQAGAGFGQRLMNLPYKVALKYYGKRAPRDTSSGLIALHTGFAQRVVQQRLQHFSPGGNSFLFEFLRICDDSTEVNTTFCSQANSLSPPSPRSLLRTLLINPSYRPSP